MGLSTATVFLTLCCLAATNYESDQLNVTIFYESYCPDCELFLRDNSKDAYKLVKYGEASLEMVPFGKATQIFKDGHFFFSCQHGPKECLGNKLHACAIWQACGETGTKGCPYPELGRALGYIYCVIKHDDQLKVTTMCAKQHFLNPNKIVECAEGDISSRLLSAYGNRTMSSKNGLPQTNYVPTVLLNEEYYEGAETNLLETICKLWPNMCTYLAEISKNDKDYKNFA